jgi:DNA-binding NtrC family response regulator
MVKSEDLETQPEPQAHGAARQQARFCPGFVVLHSRDEPGHVGAWIAASPPGVAAPRILGRGTSQPDDEFPRLRLVRQRPGVVQELGPIENRSLSRRQLLVRTVSAEALDVTNTGQCPLVVNGSTTNQSTVGPGDLLELGTQLVLLCVSRETRMPGPSPSPDHAFGTADSHGFVGESPGAWKIRAQIAMAAPHSGHVLVLGATGTGKELAATALHALSGRTGPFIARNAATLPESLVDAELFGNRKNYPNPGMPDREGLVGAADGGTLFLDEIADLPASVQTHLLRVLDAGEYQRLGETETRRSRFRLVAATNRPESTLREDLLARFDFRLIVSPIAERREDIPLILWGLFAKMADSAPELCHRFSNRTGLPELSLEFVRQLARHPFEGNVRELRSLLWSSLQESQGESLEWPADAVSGAHARKSAEGGVGVDDGASLAAEDSAAVGTPAGPPIAEIERVLAANNGSIEKSWRELGLSSRHAMQRLLRKHGISSVKQWKKA